jgi:hypothetical protein
VLEATNEADFLAQKFLTAIDTNKIDSRNRT